MEIDFHIEAGCITVLELPLFNNSNSVAFDVDFSVINKSLISSKVLSFVSGKNLYTKNINIVESKANTKNVPSNPQ